MRYRVEVKRSAAKELEALPMVPRERARQAIGGLAKEPRPSGVLKLQGEEDTYRIRVGAYRVLYTIDDVVRVVGVYEVGDRKDVYRR